MPEVWLKEYFIFPAYGLIIGILIVLFRFKKTDSGIKQSLMILSLILLIGIAAVFYLMGAQFIDHDYYFIPIFLPFVVLLAIAYVILIGNKAFSQSIPNTLSMVLCYLLIFSYFKTQARISPDYKGFSNNYNTGWMKEGKEILTKLRVPENEKIVVVNEAPPNLSLIYFDRKGYVLNRELWGEHFGWLNHLFSDYKVKYGVAKRSEFEKLTATGQEEFDKHFMLMYRNDKMVLFNRK